MRYLAIIFSIFTLTACSDIMDVESDRVVYEENHRLDNPNDSIYSVMGVVAKLQNIADRIVIMQELRGDLMTVDADNASEDLQHINSFDIDDTNSYGVRRDFYEVINNCNYILQRMDTTITEGQTRVMLPEYAQVKTLRAWTYLQMALVFGEVNYFSTPLTSTDHLGESATKLDLDALAQTLIDDLKPFASVRRLDYGSVDGWNSSQFFVDTRMLLGDLYLLTNQYALAAEAYHDLMVARSLTVSSGYGSYFTSATRDGVNSNHIGAYLNEVMTRIPFDSDLRATHSLLGQLTYSETPSLIPTTLFTTDMQQRTYFHSDQAGAISRYFDGDLRGVISLASGQNIADAFGNAEIGNASNRMLITKFYNALSGSETDPLDQRVLTSLSIYRPTQVYLRYAEAINRLGYHSVAFATLKYGLTRQNLADTLRVDSTEVKELPAYINFESSQFDDNVGVASRGLGTGLEYDSARYVLPEDVDLTEYIEELLLQEMAAETCFEGHRFFDLLRMARHRADYPALIADKVSAKYSDCENMRQKLMQPANYWAK